MNIVVIKLITFKNNNNDCCQFTNIINNFWTKTFYYVTEPCYNENLKPLQARILVV
jgi:hypothetical protein